MNAQQKLATGRLHACESRRYFTTAIMSLIPHEAPGLGTFACTKDGVLLWDPACAETWTVPQIATVIRHEVMHVLREHHERMETFGVAASKDEQMVRNVSADEEINDDEDNARDAQWPCEPVRPKTFGHPDGKLMEEYYALHQKQGGKSGQGQQQHGQGQGSGQPNQGQGSGTGKGQESAGQASGDGQGGIPKPGVGQGRCGSCAGNPVEGEEEHTHGVEGRSQVEMRRVRKQVAEAIQQEAQRGRGTVPGSWSRWAATQLTPPKIPWQQKLARAVRSGVAFRAGAVDMRYNAPSRRQAGLGFGHGRPLLPALRAPIPKVAVFVDTSGSMGTDEIAAAVRETRGVLLAVGAEVQLCACDAAVHTLKVVRSWREMAAALVGGGGTDFCPAFEALAKQRKKPEIVIAITDGQGPAPRTPPAGIKTIWVLVGRHKTKPTFNGGQPWGDFIELD